MRYAVKPKEAKEVKWMRRCLDVIIASIEAQSWQLCDRPSRDGDNHWRKRLTLNTLQVVTHGNEKVVRLGDHEVFRDVTKLPSLRPIWVRLRLAGLWELLPKFGLNRSDRLFHSPV